MNLKLFLGLAVTALVAPISLSAAEYKAPKDVKIYINPGHGRYNSNCRPMGTVKHGENKCTDTTAFYESNTNLWKALALFHKLREYGCVNNNYVNGKLNGAYSSDKTQNLVMSHISCPSWYGDDDGLSQVAYDAEEFKPDVFISIHSNAPGSNIVGDTENYPLILYRGEDYKANSSTYYGTSSFDYVTGSYELGKAIWPHLFGIEHEPYTDEWRSQWYTTPLEPSYNVRGDVDFMYYLKNEIVGSSYTLNDCSGYGDNTTFLNTTSNTRYLGYYRALKHCAVGVLCEGYMHTYYPSTNRHMNRDVCAIEGICYAHGIADYFGWEKENYGYIYGIVRDRNTKFTHTYYIPNTSTDDIYKPLNGVTVKLYKDGNLVDTYTTDDEYNGAFVFYNLEPGDYTLDYECSGYAPASEALKATKVTVKAAEISYPKAFLSQSTYSFSEFSTSSDDVSMSSTPTATYSCSDWYGGSSTNKLYPKQIAVSNDIVYLIMVGGSLISYWNPSTGTADSFSYGTSGGNGHGICTDDEGNLIFATSTSSTGYAERVQEVTVFQKSSGSGVLVSTSTAKAISLAGKYNTVLSGTNASGSTTTNSSGLTNIIRASGNCYDGTGALWFTNGRKVVKIPVINGVAQTEVVYNSSTTDSDFSSRSFGGSHNETWAKESSFFPYEDDKYLLQNRNGAFICQLSGSTIDGIEDIGWYPYHAIDIQSMNGHEILVRPTTTASTGSDDGTKNGKITVIDRTTGTTLASSFYAYGSSATMLSDSYSIVNAWCEFDKIDNNTLGLYTFTPGVGLAKYTISIPQADASSQFTNVTATSSTDADYNQDITLTWDAPNTYASTPTSYLVKYQTSYTDAGGSTVTSDWQNLGFTADGSTCEITHENVKWAVVNGEATPMSYSYKIIPNFNYYDGTASDISNTVEINFAAPSPTVSGFEVSPVYEGSSVSQYDAIATWDGVNVDNCEQYSHTGYKVELYPADDTDNAIASFTFNTDDDKYFGDIESSTGVGAVLDETGAAIEGLTYSQNTQTLNDVSTTTITFTYKNENVEVTDSNGAVRNFTTKVTALFADADGNTYTTATERTAETDYQGAVTAISDIIVANQLRIYPVPATTAINIISPVSINEVKIFSLGGALMKKVTGNGEQEMTIEVENLAPGTYLVSINALPAVKITKQ